MGLFDKFKVKPKKERMSLPPPALKPAIPNDLPEFPVDITFTNEMSKETSRPQNLFKEPEERFEDIKLQKSLPRVEDESIIKDFISPFPTKPFVLEKPYLFEVETKPVTLRDLEKEEDFEKISPVEKPVHFKLHETLRKPLFIRTDSYKQVMKNIGSSRNSVKNMEESVVRLENLKLNQNSEYEIFHKKIEDVQRKLIYTDKTIFKEW